MESWCERRLFWAIYIYKRSFYQDRLRTNIGKVEKKRDAFFAGRLSSTQRLRCWLSIRCERETKHTNKTSCPEPVLANHRVSYCIVVAVLLSKYPLTKRTTVFVSVLFPFCFWCVCRIRSACRAPSRGALAPGRAGCGRSPTAPSPRSSSTRCGIFFIIIFFNLIF
eukprot:COSAG06_NODE_12285_length_1399_cov_1.870494_1_plen_166_part_00